MGFIWGAVLVGVFFLVIDFGVLWFRMVLGCEGCGFGLMLIVDLNA